MKPCPYRKHAVGMAYCERAPQGDRNLTARTCDTCCVPDEKNKILCRNLEHRVTHTEMQGQRVVSYVERYCKAFGIPLFSLEKCTAACPKYQRGI